MVASARRGACGWGADGLVAGPQGGGEDGVGGAGREGGEMMVERSEEFTVEAAMATKAPNATLFPSGDENE